MHGLINRALQRFTEDTQGLALWAEVAGAALPGLSGFESMQAYDDDLTHAVLKELSDRLSVPVGMILEDLGTYLVCHPNTEPLRRLLRFGGHGFVDFLHSLDELADRVRLAVPDLSLPATEITEMRPGRFRLVIEPGMAGYGHVMLGLLRAMADDYGVLALVELVSDGPEGARISVSVAEAAFAEGRRFDLAPQEGAG